MAWRKRLSRFFALAAVAAAAGLMALQAGGQTPQNQNRVLVMEIEGPIGPGVTRSLEEALDEAEKTGAEALLLRMNTPGGLVTSTRAIVNAISQSSLPVIGYVAPAGAHAASAGTFILYATSLAAMAPGTNIGAATPVQMGGGGGPLPGGQGDQEDEPTGDSNSKDGDGGAGESAEESPGNQQALRNKQVNDAVAFIRSLAELHGRNADWAEKAVREAATLTAKEALEQNVVEIVAGNSDAVLAAADGRQVETGAGERELATEDAAMERFEASAITKLLGAIANPNIAFVLMMIGVYGLIFEFANPGSIGPGIIGAISLILGLYALNQLPLNYAGLALIGLGVALMIAETFSPSFGVLGAGGLGAFVFGSAMLIDTQAPGFQLSWAVILVTTAVTGTILIFVIGYSVRALKRPVAAGAERHSGVAAEVLDWSGESGHVWLQGERWSARAEGAAPEPGERVEVLRTEGLTAVVRAADESS